jgi:hypothetical protein
MIRYFIKMWNYLPLHHKTKEKFLSSFETRLSPPHVITYLLDSFTLPRFPHPEMEIRKMTRSFPERWQSA